MLNAAATPRSTRPRPPRAGATAWAANAAAPATLARLAAEHGLTLVHYSTDYVFDGTVDVHDEDEPLSPLGVYGQTKAAGDVAVGHRAAALRAAHLVGDRRRRELRAHHAATWPATASRPSVVDDQVGRLTFTDELARATRHLLDTGAAYGTYNVTNGGEPTSWRGRRPRGLRARGPLGRRRHADQHRGVRRRPGRSRRGRGTAC